MPSVTVVTNVNLSDDEIRTKFIPDFTKFCAETIGKSEENFQIDYSYHPYLSAKGTLDPAVKLQVVSLNNTTPENVQRWAEAFFKYFETNLGVSPNRGHFTFTDPGEQFVGIRGTTAKVALQKARQ